MRLVKFTDWVNGRDVWINVDAVRFIARNCEGGTYIAMNGAVRDVREPPEVVAQGFA
jgi:hypothetical protein